jgi:coenzyme PQQ precursor peptide PqqA
LRSDGQVKNLLIHHWFGWAPAQARDFVASQHKTTACFGEKKISLANFWFRITLLGRAEFVRYLKERAKMAWKSPKIVEVPVGMEINMYACAARK